MKWMDSQQLRKAFLKYFHEQDHEVVASGSLIPEHDDHTLLFTNAGMVQFKNVFLGEDVRPYSRVVSCQRCVRAGGKHNDLENVGYTKRHHTFFEMLGNFSFGDYFKREAIQFAWTFLTEVLNIPEERLWVTVFRDDQDSEAIWLEEMKIDPSRFSRCGEKDNFWSMGDIGPCGPCTEIFYDHGPELEGGPPGSKHQDSDRYVEIWNLVFMQYNRDISGGLKPLPKPCVDTGMGLERLATVMQGVHDNYDIELFQHLLSALSELTGHDDFHNTSMRVIVDHIRSAAFLVADGVIPANEGRGYVLRRIIRRAIRHGHKLGMREPFFYKLTAPLIELMGEAYPLLVKTKSFIEQTLEREELQFASTLAKGLKIFDQIIETLPGSEIPGQAVFQLYDTYGFPPDLTADMARERDLTLDYVGFDLAMDRQRTQSQQASHFQPDQTEQLHIGGTTEFTGYENTCDDGRVITLLEDNKPVTKLDEGQKGVVVLDRTPFYAESGGQVGDQGYLYFDSGKFRVKDTKKKGRVYLHCGEMIEGSLQIKEQVHAEVDPSRQDIVLNHSATHLLHEALRRVLGEHVVQKGSLVEAARLRFDFAHSEPLTAEQLQAVEHLVNQQIRANLQSDVKVTSIDDARRSGAVALFDEKYDNEVRVISMGNFSTEVCGGTHVHHSGEIGLFKITAESASAAGIRRIEAVTGNEALSWIERSEAQLQQMSSILKVNRNEVANQLMQVLEQNKHLQRELATLKQQLAHQQSGSLVKQAVEILGVQVLAVKLPLVDRVTLRTMLDDLKQKLGSAAVILATVEAEKVQLAAVVSKDCLIYFNASELLNHVASQVGGKGGGRPELAEGGGDKPLELARALKSVAEWVKGKLAAKK